MRAAILWTTLLLSLAPLHAMAEAESAGGAGGGAAAGEGGAAVADEPPAACEALVALLSEDKHRRGPFPADPSALSAAITPACRAAVEAKSPSGLEEVLARPDAYPPPPDAVDLEIAAGVICLLGPSWASERMFDFLTSSVPEPVQARCLVESAASIHPRYREIASVWAGDRALVLQPRASPRVNPVALLALELAPPEAPVHRTLLASLQLADARSATGRDLLYGTLCGRATQPAIRQYCASASPDAESGWLVLGRSGRSLAALIGSLVYVLVVHLARRTRHARTLLGVGSLVASFSAAIALGALSTALGIGLFIAIFLALKLFGRQLFDAGFQLGKALDPGPGSGRTALAGLFAFVFTVAIVLTLRPFFGAT